MRVHHIRTLTMDRQGVAYETTWCKKKVLANSTKLEREKEDSHLSEEQIRNYRATAPHCLACLRSKFRTLGSDYMLALGYPKPSAFPQKAEK